MPWNERRLNGWVALVTPLIYIARIAVYRKKQNLIYLLKKPLTTCLNCGNTFEGNYCNQCGQKAKTQKITAYILLEESLHFFTHFEKGFFHTVWAFLAQPGTASLNYVQGKRKQYQPPVSYLFICTGLYILLHNFIITHYHFHVSASSLSLMNLKEQANVLLRTHFAPFIVSTLLVCSVVIYFVLAKPALNFAEVLVLSLYGGGTYILLLFLSDAIWGFIGKNNIITPGVFIVQSVLSSLYNFWFCFNLFSKMRIRFLWLRLFTTAILMAAIGWALFTYLPMAWLYIFPNISAH